MDPNQDAPLKITINGQEYDTTEAQELIDKGRATREAEVKYNTKLDNVWPEYGKSRDALKAKDEELDKARKQIEEFNSKQKEGEETPTDVKKARQAAKTLGIILDEDLEKSGYIKKDDLDSYLSERETKKAEEQKAINEVLGQADTLEKEIDGQDGRPKFKKSAVLAYASAYKFPDLKSAYEDMNKDELTEWKEAQIAKEKARKGMDTLKGGGVKSPKDVKIDDSNFKDNLKEALWGGKAEE